MVHFARARADAGPLCEPAAQDLASFPVPLALVPSLNITVYSMLIVLDASMVPVAVKLAMLELGTLAPLIEKPEAL